MKKVELYTDGACSGNPGRGGFGIVLKYKETEKTVSKGYKFTTNNRMELTAVIEALDALKEPRRATLTTDSTYVCDAINKGWVYSWKKNGWKKSDKKPALNVDLWEKLLNLLDNHKVTFCWVKGHNGHKYNERCDKLAVGEYQQYL